MKFNEWLTQRGGEEFATSNNLGMETVEDMSLIENQLEQWVTRLAGLLQNLPEETKRKLLGKVVESINEIS